MKKAPRRCFRHQFVSIVIFGRYKPVGASAGQRVKRVLKHLFRAIDKRCFRGLVGDSVSGREDFSRIVKRGADGAELAVLHHALVQFVRFNHDFTPFGADSLCVILPKRMDSRMRNLP